MEFFALLRECGGWWPGWLPLLPTHGLQHALLLLRTEVAAGVLRPETKRAHPRSTGQPISRPFARRTFGRFANESRPCPASRERNRRVAPRLSGIAQMQLVFYPWRPTVAFFNQCSGTLGRNFSARVWSGFVRRLRHLVRFKIR